MSRRLGFLSLGLLAYVGIALAQPVVITTPATLPDGYLNLSYGLPPGFQGLQFTDQTQPSQATTSWSILEGGNPAPGISITSSGFLSGTPTAVGDFTFVVRAATAYGSATGNFTMHVTTPKVTISTISPIPGAFINPDQPYNFLFSGTATPPLGITWSADPTGLPPGLFMNSSGLLSGFPTTPGQYSFVVVARLTGTNVTTSGTFTITIYNGQVRILTNTLPVAIVGQGYNTKLLANPAGVIWSLSGSDLPIGFNFDPQTGILSGGTSVAGIYKFAVQAAYQNYQSATAILTLYVATGPLKILEDSLPIAIQGSPYRTTLTPSGGLEPFQWALSGTNTLGFTIDPNTGTITGTPTVAAGTSYPLTVLLSDVTGTRVLVPYSVFVAAPLSISTTKLPNGTINVAYNQALTAAGGQAPYSWILPPNQPGFLPPGLSMGTDGVIRGTPTTNGAFPFLVQVTDFGRRSALANLTITIGANITLSIGPATLCDGIPGVPYSVQLSVTGTGSSAKGPFKFSADANSLPVGLSLSPDGLISGTPVGPPRAPLGTSSFTVTVIDSSSATAPLSGQKTYTLNITLPLSIGGSTALPDGTIGAAYPQASVQASGGDPVYTYSIDSGTMPAGLILNTTTGAITGTPTGPAGVSTFTVKVQDTGCQIVQKQFTVRIVAPPAPPVVSTGNLSGTVGTAFSATLQATGGTSPYTFALTSGTTPAGISFSAANATLSGTPTAAGSASLTFTVTDAQQLTATKAITVTISLPPAPPAAIGTISANPAQQPGVNLTLGNTFPVDIIGTLSLSFKSDAGGSPTEVQFLPAASQTVNVTIPAGQSTASQVPVVATGTVAGTITITARLTAGGVDVTPTPAPTQTIVIKPAAPVIQSVVFSNTGGGVTVTVVGYSTTREVTTGDFVFAVSTGNTVSNGGAVSISLSSAFATWFQSSASNPFGGQFKLTIPFNVANGTSAQVTSVSVKLTNTVGTSAAASPQ